MKKNVLLLILLMLILTTGCTNSKNKRSLEDIYIKIAEKIESNEEVTKEYRNNLLEGYKITETDDGVIEETGSKYTMKTYTNGDEKLILSDIKYDEEDALELYYEKNNGSDGIALGYTSYDEYEKANEVALVSISVSNSKSYKKINNILEDENTDLENIYTQVSTKMDTKEGINIDEVIDLAGEQPSSKVVNHTKISEKLTCYYYNNEKELLEVYTIKGDENVIRVYYDRSDKLLIKETLKDELLKDKDITYVNSTTTYVDDISTQKKILKAVG